MSELEKAVKSIAEKGYFRLPGVYTRERMTETLDRIHDWHARTKDDISDKVPFLNRNQPTFYNPQIKDIYFLKLLFEPAVMQQILMHFLNDPWYKPIPQDQPNYILRSLVARSTNERTAMHIDSFVPYLGKHVFIMQYSIILEDQNAENGCTVVVPGSHLAGEYTTQEAFDKSVPIESQAGDIVMWDSRLWHGTRENRSTGTRWALIATFCRWWIKQHFNTVQTMPQEIYSQLTDSQKAVMGFCSVPYMDEREGIDLKRGYDSLLPDVSGYKAGEPANA